MDPVIYYSRVLLEVTLLSSKHQTMNPLALPGQFSEAFGALKNFFGSFQNGTWRNVKLAEVRTMAARGVEVLGFFTIGEMIGRKNIIGYKVEGVSWSWARLG